MKKYIKITPEMREAVKQRFFNNPNNTTIAIAKELNYSLSTTSKIINDLLNDKMQLVHTRKNNQNEFSYE